MLDATAHIGSMMIRAVLTQGVENNLGDRSTGMAGQPAREMGRFCIADMDSISHSKSWNGQATVLATAGIPASRCKF
jgi:hypothetical protein